MTLDDLRALADKFFVWPEGSGRQTVTTFSALLFAKHVLQLREKSLGAQNSASTPTLREAAQQALEALEGWDNYGKWVWPESALEQAKRNTTESLAALRAALEQQAEPVQEPVAWMCPEDPERETAFNWRPGHCENCGKKRIPLYTAPPQRKPLTDDEILEMVRAAPALGSAEDEWLHVDRAIERTHGIGEEE